MGSYNGMPASADERYLRRLLAVRVGIPGAYYDDGEAHGLQHGISIDFMRDPVADIDAKLQALNVARAEVTQQEQPVQEPVALEKLLHQVIYGDFNADNTDDLKLALAARKDFAALQPRRGWQILSEEEIINAVWESDLDWRQGWTLEDSEPNRYTQLARVIEARLKEKNA